ncbi:MAG: TIGR01212 family radical SAM protein [Candidatus Goldiibacteriota bacterium]
MNLPYLSLNNYFRKKYNHRVQKITVSLPFTCPNIDGTKGEGGCIYCSGGSVPPGNNSDIPLHTQIKDGISKGMRKYGGKTRFLVYFQTNTNTYSSPENLKKIYDTALGFEEVIGMDIGTRPDCVNKEILELIASYKDKMREIWVEYGLQSANEDTLLKINRGHGVSDFTRAVNETKKHGLKTAAHIIIGFPWETAEDFRNSALLLAGAGIDAVKIHPLHIIEGTRLAAIYKKEKFGLLSIDQYAEIAAQVIKILPPETVIMRFTAEADKEKLIAPEYCRPEYKARIRDMIIRELQREEG